MPLSSFKKIPPIYEFRNVDEETKLQIPEVAENRKCTDTAFLIFFLLSMLVVISLVSVGCTVGTDYQRFLYGYDSCGDTCAADNSDNAKTNCSGKDLTDKPIMKYRFAGKNNGTKRVKSRLVPDQCVDECEKPSRLLFHRCIPPESTPQTRQTNRIITFVELVHDLRKSVNILILPMCFIALLLSICLLLCLRFLPHRTVCGILVATLCGCSCFTIYLWYCFVQNTENSELLYIGIITTIVIFFLSIFICYFYDRYDLLADMFKEATEAIFKAPYLLLVPVMTLLFLYVVAVAEVFLVCLMSTNQYLKEADGFPNVYEYIMTSLARAGITYLVLTFVWLQALANGCQCIMVAGPVSAYYFEKLNGSKQRSPVLTTCYVLFRYHFGTVAFGSLCITIVTAARFLPNFFEDYLNCKRVAKGLRYCLACLEGVVEYLTRRAYIQTALHGQPLYKSGMRAARVLWANLMQTLALDVVADFIMACAMVLVILVSVGVGICIHELANLQLNHFWTVLLIGGVACGTIVYFFMQITNVATETIFVCFCEDKLMNDGKKKPYFMSESLKTLVEDAKRATKRREGS